jgi:hypothetical protein
MFLPKNFDNVFGILPLINFAMHLNASAVLLNLWKSSKVILCKALITTFVVWQCPPNTFVDFTLFQLSLAYHIERERNQLQFRTKSTLLLISNLYDYIVWFDGVKNIQIMFFIFFIQNVPTKMENSN